VIQRRGLPDGWIVVMRLGDPNKSILDYLLVPTTGTDRNIIRFVDKNRSRLGIDRFESADSLIRSVSRRTTRLGRVSSTKQAPPSKRSKSSQPKKKTRRTRP
jgi:hypothetical protein